MGGDSGELAGDGRRCKFEVTGSDVGKGTMFDNGGRSGWKSDNGRWGCECVLFAGDSWCR